MGFLCIKMVIFIDLCQKLLSVKSIDYFWNFYYIFTVVHTYIWEVGNSMQILWVDLFWFQKGTPLIFPTSSYEKVLSLSSTQMASDFAICQVHGELKCILHTNILHRYVVLSSISRVVGKS